MRAGALGGGGFGAAAPLAAAAALGADQRNRGRGGGAGDDRGAGGDRRLRVVADEAEGAIGLVADAAGESEGLAVLGFGGGAGMGHGGLGDAGHGDAPDVDKKQRARGREGSALGPIG